jgi:hypothetical protein
LSISVNDSILEVDRLGKTDNTMTKRGTDNTMTKKRHNAMTKRGTDNTMTKRRTP